MSELNNEQDLNEEILDEIDDAEVITVPIDDTLSISGEAADAKAVGDALALKADASSIVAISVNGQTADLQGAILVDGSDIPAQNDSDTESVAGALARIGARTAADIPMSSAQGAQSIADAIGGIGGQTADVIPMSESDPTTVASALAAKFGAEDIDTSLSKEGKPAEGKATGTAITAVQASVRALSNTLPHTVNGQGPDSKGNILLTEVMNAQQLIDENNQSVTGEFIVRPAGGYGSVGDGPATLVALYGRQIHEGVVEEVIQLDVIPIERTAPPAITATLDADDFREYVQVAGTYEMTYGSSGWDNDPALYGVAVSNDPVEGDVISVAWDGTNAPVMTVDPAERTAPEPITAVIDPATFREYVNESGVYTLYYTTEWSETPANYGVTVTGDPWSGDSIKITYVMEDRGTITPATPSSLTATGWNLYDGETGRARCCKYHEEYGYRIDGTFTGLKWAASVSGTQTTITPDENGLFQVPADGWLFVTGGSTDTCIYPTWSDWTEGYEGDFESYTETVIDLTSAMAYFPGGLCRVGTVYDEINLDNQQIIQRIDRIEFTPENLASIIASGRAYDADTDWIYAVRTSEAVGFVEIENKYTVSEHGLEILDGSDDVPPFTVALYGLNLKDKLKRQVLIKDQQTLTGGEQSQVRSNIGAIGQSELNQADGCVAIVATGNTAPKAIAAGQYVIWKGDLHTARSAIANGAALSSSNLLAVGDGGLNSLKGEVDALNSNFNTRLGGFAYDGSIGGNSGTYTKDYTNADNGTYLIISGCSNTTDNTRYGLHIMNIYVNNTGTQNRILIRDVLENTELTLTGSSPEAGKVTLTCTTTSSYMFAWIYKIR